MNQRSYRIHLRGQVQGVGFRPFVWRLANELGLLGWVNNSADGLRVGFNADPAVAQVFYEKIRTGAPPLARIERSELAEVPPQFFEKFEIAPSSGDAEPDLPITPDFALCEACAADLRQPGNRRQGYAFTTCTSCGPRYSILRRLPYDREATAMQPFAMCPDCQREYDDVTDRRYFSQTNSCPACGVQLAFFDAAKNSLATGGAAPLARAVEALRQGSIVAAKGIGGYLLLCDAANRTALSALRERKHRPTKPFALLYPSLERLEKDAAVPDEARQWLQGPVAPIVLLPLLQPTGQPAVAFDLVAPGLDCVGAMLPYSPLLRLLADGFGGVLVATSGNLSGSPIVFDDAEALDRLTSVADFVLSNDRAILTPQDDSVWALSTFHRAKIVLRRSRGLAPSLYLGQWPEGNLLAMGASMKSTFCRLHRRNVYVSQYLGDLESFDTQQHYQRSLQHLSDVLGRQPDKLLLDRHPGYFSTQLGEELAADLGVETVRIQHHEAHFAAVLAENGLLDPPEPVLGVIWDGTGLGTDGQVWGGEFFLWENEGPKRVAQLQYFDFLLGDKMPREPRISALSLCHCFGEAEGWLANKFTPNEGSLYRRLLDRGGLLQTSSVGRLFDGVASLLGLGDVQSFEGEAAMRLEQLALRHLRQQGLRSAPSWIDRLDGQGQVPLSPIVNGVLHGLRQGQPPGAIAASFHQSLIEAVRLVARHWGAKKLAFSGGVFQNGLLVDLAIECLGEEFDLFFHHHLSPNDECVSFGQLIMGMRG